MTYHCEIISWSTVNFDAANELVTSLGGLRFVAVHHLRGCCGRSRTTHMAGPDSCIGERVSEFRRSSGCAKICPQKSEPELLLHTQTSFWSTWYCEDVYAVSS